MKISLIIPVLNEAQNIGFLLDSILTQTRKPDEIIVVDDCSTDNTIKKIKSHKLWQKKKIRLLVSSGKNCSRVRNLGISSAQYDILALTDAGCVLDKNWLKNITQPFSNPKIGSVAGFYQVHTPSAFSQAVTPFVAVMPDQLKEEIYLPSSRSIAFRKSAWKQVGEYPENLNYCDDLVFAQKLKISTRMVVAKNALVYWEPVKDLTEFFNKIKNYASGDVQAGYWPHLRKICSVFIRYIIFYFFPLLFIAYLIWPIIKFNRYVTKPTAILLLPVLQVICDLAIMRGSLAGLKLRLI